jgi:hypothetical protein
METTGHTWRKSRRGGCHSLRRDGWTKGEAEQNALSAADVMVRVLFSGFPSLVSALWACFFWTFEP